MVVSGSEENVAKTFPKIIQTVKKRIVAFPILLRRLFLKMSRWKSYLDGVSSILSQNVEWSRGLRVKYLSVTDAAPSHLYRWFIWIFKRDWLEVRGAGLNFGPSLIHWGRNHSKNFCADPHWWAQNPAVSYQTPVFDLWILIY